MGTVQSTSTTSLKRRGSSATSGLRSDCVFPRPKEDVERCAGRRIHPLQIIQEFADNSDIPQCFQVPTEPREEAATLRIKMSLSESSLELAAVAPDMQVTQREAQEQQMALVVYSKSDQTATQAGNKITESIAFLERIEKIEIQKVVKRSGHNSYVLEMFLRSEHPRPSQPVDPVTAHVNPLVGKQLESNYQVDHRFTDFAELRRVLRYISHSQGGKAHVNQCSYCKDMLGFIDHSIWQPGVLVHFGTTKAMQKQVLTKFMRKIVQLAVSSKSCEKWSCEAYYHVPLLVEKFLRKPKDTSLGII